MKKKYRFGKPKKRRFDDLKEFYKVLQGKSDLGEEIDNLVDKAEKMATDYELALEEGRLKEESPYRKIIEIYKRIIDIFISKGWKEQALIYADQIKFYQDEWERDKKLRKLEYQKIQRQKDYRDSLKVKAITENRRRYNYDDTRGEGFPYIIRRFEDREGIAGVIICDLNGRPIDSNIDIDISESTSADITSLIRIGKQLVEALKEGGLKFIRLETSKGEIMIALEEQLILIILKGEKRARKRFGGDRFPYPYIFTHPRPPDDFAAATQVQVRAPFLKEKESEGENNCQYCGMKLTKEEQLTHSCKKKPDKNNKL